MKKLITLVAVLALIIGAVAAFVFKTESGQNMLLKRVLTTTMSRTPDTFDGLRVVVCGSASPLGGGMDRAQACIAVVTPEHFFLIDVGARSPTRIRQAQLPMGRLNGVLLTHFHSDHIAALPDVNLTYWIGGRPGPLNVYGPPGVDTVVAGFNTAYELDRKYRTAHHGSELLDPERGPMQANSVTPGSVVWEDDLLKVTSFRVEHDPIDPAVGYRVDYRGRSVVVSGDSNASDSLFAAAQGADLLLHDALSRAMLDPMIATATELNVPTMPKIMTDVIDYHADTLSLPERADAAGISQLALYHLVPVPPNDLAEQVFRRGLPDDVILTKDLQVFDFPTDSKEIIIREP